jgi:taurine dioxygenase
VGVDLGTIADEALAEVHAALGNHDVVFFRDQTLTPEQHLGLTRRFGRLCDVPHASRRLNGYPDILEVVDKRTSGIGRNVGGTWHTDMPFLERPPAQAILYAKQVPERGGDTQWASLSAAYAALSAGLRATLESLRSVHSATRIAGSRFVGTYTREVRPPIEEMDREVVHPLVRTLPDTGRRCLFVNRSTFLRFDGWSETESQPLHEFLCHHVVRPEFTCRFRWSVNAVAIWDNRSTQHYAIDDYGDGVRTMYRTTVLGDRPA